MPKVNNKYNDPTRAPRNVTSNTGIIGIKTFIVMTTGVSRRNIRIRERESAWGVGVGGSMRKDGEEAGAFIFRTAY